MDILLLIVGLGLILAGANFLTDGSAAVAQRLRVPEFIIGLTIVAVGTSTPELVVSVLSAIAGKSDVAIGNIVGSNIFNVFVILGICALIRPLPLTRSTIRRDIPIGMVVSLLLISVPTFVTGFVMQYFLGVEWRILPVTAGANPGFLDLLMPAMVLGSVSMAYIIRLSRTEISSNKSEDYVRTARAKGMTNGQVTLRHILRNSLIPVVTYLGSDIGALMGGAMITERIFNIQGVGNTLYQGILRGEGTLVVSIVTIMPPVENVPDTSPSPVTSWVPYAVPCLYQSE